MRRDSPFSIAALILATHDPERAARHGMEIVPVTFGAGSAGRGDKTMRELLIPRRIVMMAIAVVLLGLCFAYGRWDWLWVPKYQKMMLTGIWNTLSLLVITMVMGMALAIPLGLAQAVGPSFLNANGVVWDTFPHGLEIGGTYLAMEGPQFSTLAESRLYRSWNCDVIGMTNMPEAKLAREAELCYASVAMVTDSDCWHPDHDAVDVAAAAVAAHETGHAVQLTGWVGVAYPGFPRSLNALGELIKVLEARRRRGVQDAPGREPAAPRPVGPRPALTRH